MTIAISLLSQEASNEVDPLDFILTISKEAIGYGQMVWSFRDGSQIHYTKELGYFDDSVVMEEDDEYDPEYEEIMNYDQAEYEAVSYTHLTLPTKRIV